MGFGQRLCADADMGRASDLVRGHVLPDPRLGELLFLLDSSAMDISINSAKKIKPDAIEILPGLVPKLIAAVKKEVDIPIVTGGFIETEEEVRSCLAAGALSASTSHKPLWEKIELIRDEQRLLHKE